MGTLMLWLAVSLLQVGTGTEGGFPAVRSGLACPAVGPLGAPAGVDTGAMISLRLGRDAAGAMRIEGTAGDLRFEHQVRPDGRLDLRLRRGSDRVSVSADRRSVEVVRNGRRATLLVAGANEADLLAVERLLAGSSAVFRFRRSVAALSPERRRTIEGAAAQMADALLGGLSGDPGAVPRFVDGLRANRLAVRRASLDDDPSCYERWEAQAIRTYDDYFMCVVEVWILRDLCSLRFILAAEANWFELLGCVAFPFRATE